MTNLPGLDENDYPFELDFSSSEKFYEVLLDQVFDSLRGRRASRQRRTGDTRQREIITQHAQGKTLDEIGRSFGVTRERIRQIERKVWIQVAANQARLKTLENLIVSIVKRSGGFDKVENVAKTLRKKLGWTDREVRYLLNHYFEELTDRFVFVDRDETYVSLADQTCWKCRHFQKLVKEMVKELEGQNESLTLDEFARKVRQRMDDCPRCKDCRSKMGTPSPELFLWLFKNDAELSQSHEKMTVRRASHFLGLNRSVLLVLKMAKRPLTKTEILNQLKEMFPKKNFSIKQIQSTTSNSPQCYDKIFLWDRGGIHSETLYIHKDYIKIDLPILDTLEKILIQKASEGVVPQVRLNRLFNKYYKECCEQGIPNVYALFSCLKVRGCPQFTFQRSPYIGFKGNHQKISNARILENFVKSSDHPVSRLEMREFGRTLGLQDEHISNTIVLTNLIATQRGYVYREDNPEKSPAFLGIVEHAKERLGKETTFLVSDLFRSEKAACAELKIIDSKMLYSLLRRNGDSGLHLKYPFIFHPSLSKPERGGAESGK